MAPTARPACWLQRDAVVANGDAVSVENAIEMRQVCTSFGSHQVHSNLDMEVRRGEILAIVGGSGSGKSTLLREMIMLQKPNSGRISLFGQDIHNPSSEAALALRLRFGVMFQHGGLFAALTVSQNIGLPLREHSRKSEAEIDAICAAKLALSGLAPEVGLQFPNQLSGGMLKRASLARALALEPELLFLDEPTAGLDPAGAAGIDTLVRQLHATEVKGARPTIVMITHDLDLLWQVTDRVLVLHEGKVLASGTMAELSGNAHPVIRGYFDGPRGRAAALQQKAQPRPASGAQPDPSAPMPATQSCASVPASAQMHGETRGNMHEDTHKDSNKDTHKSAHTNGTTGKTAWKPK